MERSAELHDLCVALSEAHSRADTPFIERHVSRQEGVLSIGSGPNEWIEGAQVLEGFKEALQDEEVRSSPSEDDFVRELDAFVEGTVGWASSRFSWTTKDSKEIPMRCSAVFHRDAGRRLSLHIHRSAWSSTLAIWKRQGRYAPRPAAPKEENSRRLHLLRSWQGSSQGAAPNWATLRHLIRC